MILGHARRHPRPPRTPSSSGLRRLDTAKSVGLASRIADRERANTVYWIDVDVVPPATLPDAARLEGEAGRILRPEVNPCPSDLT